jgi:hypothetical protein
LVFCLLLFGGREFAVRYRFGNASAARLYATSSFAVAHTFRGLTDAFGVALASSETVVIGHGGVSRAPGFGPWVREILERDAARPIQLVLTDAVDTNAYLNGAAVIAVGNLVDMPLSSGVRRA